MPVSTSALLVFFKWPEAGRVKTRLTPPLAASDAARLYTAFVKDTFAKVIILPDVKIFGYVAGMLGTGQPLETDLKALPLTLRMQHGKDLGERMSKAFQEVFCDGFQRVVIIGTDSPDLPLSYISTAFDTLRLSQNALCLGATDDGGYYLLGMNRFFPEVFQHVPYSSTDTYRATLKQIVPLHARLFTLRRWYDVDTLDDLSRLALSLHAKDLPHTAFALAQLSHRFSIPHLTSPE